MSDIMTIEELAAYLQIGKKTIWTHYTKGDMPVVRLGGKIRFLKSSIDKWIESKEVVLNENSNGQSE
jgi:excisionase family DNA binding protein